MGHLRKGDSLQRLVDAQESQPHDDSFSPLADAAEVLAAEAMAEAVERIKAGAESQGMDVPRSQRGTPVGNP